MELRIMTVKDYQVIFSISERTARSWYHNDLEALGRDRITQKQFEMIYCTCEPIPVKVSRKKTVKSGK